MSDPLRLATVVLVDARGRLLLQERDSGAPYGADQWGMTGGHVEPGETHQEAAHRELGEETGLTVPSGALSLWHEETFALPDRGEAHLAVYVGPTEATDADVVLGEGRQIVFVDAAEVAALDLTVTARRVLPQLLASPAYARLRDATRRTFASVLLRDRRGHLLLQERDEHPRIDPDRWGFVGGHVDPGEDVEAAAYRELAEETGISLDDGLTCVGTFQHFHEATGEWHHISMFTGGTDLADDDVVTGEGRRIVFVDPDDVRRLPLTVGAAQVLPVLLPDAFDPAPTESQETR